MSFNCTICGENKDDTQRAAKHMRYCRTCHNDYQTTRRIVVRAGRQFSMDAYKRSRVKRGLPTLDYRPKRGRPQKVEDSYYTCYACKEDKVYDATSAFDNMGVCKECALDYGRQKEMIEGLSLQWYILFRNLVIGFPDGGKPTFALVPTNTEGISLGALRGLQGKCQRNIAMYGTPEALEDAIAKA